MPSTVGVSSLSPAEARELFVRLHPAASDAQLGKEVETLLTSPLLVRLAQVLGESETTVGITPGRLLRAHADRTVLIDPVRSHLALKNCIAYSEIRTEKYCFGDLT